MINKELLEVLKEVVQAAELVEAGKKNECQIDYADWLVRARLAISKAETVSKPEKPFRPVWYL
jgi:hypothetical protein